MNGIGYVFRMEYNKVILEHEEVVAAKNVINLYNSLKHHFYNHPASKYLHHEFVYILEILKHFI
jgi:hypothetical protein